LVLVLSLVAADDLEKEREQLHRHWQQQQERAHYQADRARRQYDATEPENRLVARELERRWEEALKEQRRLEEEYTRFCRSQPQGLSPQEREQIRALAQEVPALWQAATTTAADRQRIVRLLVEEVKVAVQGESERVEVVIRWAGGQISCHEIVRPVKCYEQMSEYSRLLRRIDELRNGGCTLTTVAEQLNREGFRPPKRSATFSKSILSHLLWGKGAGESRLQAVRDSGLLHKDEWLLSDLARELKMPTVTLHRWIYTGWVHARKLPTSRGHWAIWADSAERERMTKLRNCPRGWADEPLFEQLTKPKSRNKNER
jgi:hypothetical protein